MPGKDNKQAQKADPSDKHELPDLDMKAVKEEWYMLIHENSYTKKEPPFIDMIKSVLERLAKKDIKYAGIQIATLKSNHPKIKPITDMMSS